MRVLTEWLRLESRSFRYKVAPYLSYLHIKFEDDIKGNSFEFHAYVPIRLCPKLNWRLCLALFAARFRSYWDLTQIYGTSKRVIEVYDDNVDLQIRRMFTDFLEHYPSKFTLPSSCDMNNLIMQYL